MQNRSEMKFLVVGYNGCAFTLNGKRQDMLSETLIQFAKDGSYDGFYGLTQRCLVRLGVLYQSSEKKLAATNYSASDLQANFPTYKITDNLIDATELQLQTVSTLEDLKIGKCGAGFEKVIEPFEKHGSKPDSETPYIENDCEAFSLMKDDIENGVFAKNKQILQIAIDAAHYNAEATKITIDIVDDNVTHAKRTLLACNDKMWPEKVVVRSFHYDSSKPKTVDLAPKEITDSTVKPRKKRDADTALGQTKPSQSKKPAIRNEDEQGAQHLATMGMFAKAQIRPAEYAPQHKYGLRPRTPGGM